MNLVGSSISEGFQKVFSQVSPSTAIALVAGIGLGAAITYAARGFFSEREIAVLPTESETIEELRSQLVEAQNELLKKTLDSVDPNPDLLDEIASLQDQLSLKNGNAARLMGEYEEELQALKIRLASQKTEVAVHSTLPSTDAGVEHRIAQLQASQRKLQEKLNAVQALSDRNAREAFSAEESAKES